jgi:hypothetical protein
MSAHWSLLGAKRTSTKPRQSSSVYEYALIDCEPTISMTKRITPTDMAVGRLLACEPQRSPRSIPRTHCIVPCCGSKPVLAEAGSGLATAKIASPVRDCCRRIVATQAIRY